jgi:hypothetical protein
VGDWFRVDDRMSDSLPGGQRAIEVFGRPAPLTVYPDVRMDHSDQVMPGCLALARSFGPDLIVPDSLECDALILGGVLGVPVVRQRWWAIPCRGRFARPQGRRSRTAARRTGSPICPIPPYCSTRAPRGSSFPTSLRASRCAMCRTTAAGCLPTGSTTSRGRSTCGGWRSPWEA